MHAVDQTIEHVGKVEFAIDQFVTHACPTGFFGGDDLDAVFLVDTQDRCHHHAGAVGEWDKANLDFFFFRLVGALCIDCRTQGGGDGQGSSSASLQHITTAHGGLQKIRHVINSLKNAKNEKGVHTQLAIRKWGGDAFVQKSGLTSSK